MSDLEGLTRRAGVLLVVVLGLLYGWEILVHTVRWNLTPSVGQTRGILLLLSAPDEVPVGALVLACPSPSQALVLHRLAPDLVIGRSCRPFPTLLKRVAARPKGLYDLRGDHPRSLDSRRLGPFERRQIQARAIPLVTF
jgi:type IV secretory pathway protease TraF